MKKPQIDITSFRAKQAFEAAAASGKLDRADEIEAQFPDVIDDFVLVDVAKDAIQRNDKNTTFFIKKIEARVPASNDILRRIYNTLMDASIRAENTAGIDYLLGKSQTGYASGMAAAAHYDAVDSLRHFMTKAKKEGVKLEQIDLDVTLSIAADHNSFGVISELLDKGVSARVYDDKLLKRAIDAYLYHGFEPVEKALEAGAPASLARAYAAEVWPNYKTLQDEIAAAEKSIAAASKAVKAKNFKLT